MENELKIVFAGTPEFSTVPLHALIKSRHKICGVFTQPDRPAGRGRQLQPSSVKHLAQLHRIKVFQPATLKAPEVWADLQALEADLMVVVAYGLILPQEILTIPLPRWRGAAPIQRAILAGDQATGITIIQMDAGLDTGEMLKRMSCRMESMDTAGSLHDRLAHLGAETLMLTIEAMLAGQITPEAQDDADACYASKLTKAEALLRWDMPGDQLEREIRAFNPWPVAYTMLDEERLRIWQARWLSRSSDSSPGSIIKADKEGIDVATGRGVLRLLNVQVAGGREMAAANFLNAHPIKLGTVLGD